MENDQKKDLQWGEHHSGEKGAVRNKEGKLITDKNELLSSENLPSNLADEEPERNREGVREGASNVDKPSDQTAD